MQAREVADLLAYAESASFVGFVDRGCADATFAALHTPAGAGGCSCGCDDGAPAALLRAQSNIQDVMETLLGLGTRMEEDIEIAAQVVDDDLWSWPEEDYAEWPLAQPLANTAGLVVTDLQGPAPSEPARFSGSDAAALRTLLEQSPGLQPILIRQADTRYVAAIREALPSGHRDALDALLFGSSSWSR